MRHSRSCLCVCAVILLCAVQLPSWAEAPKPKHAPDALPGVEPEMLNPEYWIALQDNADKIVMTPAEIERFNENTRNEKVVFKDRYGKPDPLIRNYNLKLQVGLFVNPIKPLELPNTLPGDSLRVWIKRNIEWLYSRDFYDGRNVLYSDRMIRELIDKMNLDAIPDVISRRYGLIVKRADVRLFPTAIPGYSELKYEMDNFQNTSVYIIQPVSILHKSLDGDYLYVETHIARGWIAVEEIALADKQEIRELTEDTHFLMAAGHKVSVYFDSLFENFAQYFYFSATLPLDNKDSNSYEVKLPYRNTDGTLSVTYGYVKPDADVHIGRLPYSKRNVITQIFKLLHQPYGWADQLNNRDCSGTIRVLFQCFGFVTGRWTSFLLLAGDHQTYINPDLNEEEKMAEVAKIEPVITLAGTGGHVILYLGKGANGKLYFMHQGGWGYDEGDQHYYVNRIAINAADHKWYSINSPRVFTTYRP